jgi:UDP-GlcNAc:undecaprenyl-phosphate GlcNAc-1-phosphate transferase
MILPILSLTLVSFVISWVLTFVVRRVAIRVGFTDKPGHRKIHSKPIALGGGIAITWAFALPMLGALVYAWTPPQVAHIESVAPEHAIAGGIRLQTPMALFFVAGIVIMHLMGLWDDRKAMGPYSKLFVQLALAAAIVALNPTVRALTAWGYVPSLILTVLWITAVTNAFNFLDNMDGLSAGVACVCAMCFLVAALSIGQWFVAASLALLIGALLGFLCFNFAPASIFMGDSGSLVIGFILGVLTIRTQYLPRGQDFGAGWYAVFVPVIVLAVPLYDLIVVSLIRIARGVSPFKGDTNHFSHRLVARGMSKRTAVLCLYLISAATGLGAIILPHARSPYVAVLIFSQTLLILGVVALLEQHPVRPKAAGVPAPGSTREPEIVDVGAASAAGAGIVNQSRGG